MKNLKTIFLLACLLSVAGCGAGRGTSDGDYASLSGFALGTTFAIRADVADTAVLVRAVDSIFVVVDGSMSVFNPRSLLSRINRGETDSVDCHIARCIETAAGVSALGGGRYDVTVRPLTLAWGFNGREPERHPNVDSLLQFVGYRKISIKDGRLIKEDPRMQIDLNSVAKGYTVDLLAARIAALGAANFIVEVGGEIVCRGVRPDGRRWQVGVDSPVDGNYIPGRSLQVRIAPGDAALATSGNYRNFYIDADGRKVVHTIDALTGMSRATDLLSATVVGPACALADAWCTMLMTVGAREAIALLESQSVVSGYLVYTDPAGDYRVWTSPALEGMIVE